MSNIINENGDEIKGKIVNKIDIDLANILKISSSDENNKNIKKIIDYITIEINSLCSSGEEGGRIEEIKIKYLTLLVKLLDRKSNLQDDTDVKNSKDKKRPEDILKTITDFPNNE